MKHIRHNTQDRTPHKKQRIGHALIARAEDFIRKTPLEKEAREIFLTDATKLSNPFSRFYEKMGYAPAPDIDDVNGLTVLTKKYSALSNRRKKHALPLFQNGSATFGKPKAERTKLHLIRFEQTLHRAVDEAAPFEQLLWVSTSMQYKALDIAHDYLLCK